MTASQPAPPGRDGSAVVHWTAIDWDPFTANRLVDDLRMRYVDYGSGPALVLLHGMGASWHWWLENIPALARQHRVIAVDLPGFGNSEPLPAPAEMAMHAGAVFGLMDQLDIDSATVVGHSMGGLVALEMATAEPRRVQDLILVGSGGVPMTRRHLAAILVVVRTSTAVLRRPVVRRALVAKQWLRRLALRGGFHDPRAVSPELAALMMPLFGGPGSVDATAAAGRAVRAMEPSTVTCPVLLIWGKHDVMVPLRCAHDLDRLLTDSELIVIPEAGHTPMIEYPDEFNSAVLTYTGRRG